MPLGQLLRYVALLLIALSISAVPADAHRKKHHAHPVSSTTKTLPDANSVDPLSTQAKKDEHMAGMMEAEAEERASMSIGARLLDWLGRLHPIIVHFPISFFPAALFTAIVGRRRPPFRKPVQFLVVAGGIIAPIAAILGWLNAIGADPDPLLTVHRWLGTAIGIAALGLGLWAWRQPEDDLGPGMIVGLTIITVAIVVQGWFGGAMVHGMDHLSW